MVFFLERIWSKYTKKCKISYCGIRWKNNIQNRFNLLLSGSSKKKKQ